MTALMARRALLSLALIALPSVATAWGPTGHRVTARIAQNHLSPAATRQVEALVGPAGLAPISTWADEIKSEPRYTGRGEGAIDTRPWHYINAEDAAGYDALVARTASDDRIDHLVDALRQHEAVLADREAPAAQRAEALRWIVHLIGDLHQPLHVGRAEDKGGNAVKVQWFGQPSNLHRVWDSGLIDSQQLSFSEYVSFIDHAPAERVKATQRGTYDDWAKEGIALRPQVYDIWARKTKDGRPELFWAYRYRCKPIIDDRLLAGGLRLAARLNALLGP